jgi:hypothetical protein
MKIQETLPLLGNDVLAANALNNPVGCGAVHTTKEGEDIVNPVYVAKVTIQLDEPSPMDTHYCNT